MTTEEAAEYLRKPNRRAARLFLERQAAVEKRWLGRERRYRREDVEALLRPTKEAHG
jgi:hypothetical protein